MFILKGLSQADYISAIPFDPFPHNVILLDSSRSGDVKLYKKNGQT